MTKLKWWQEQVVYQIYPRSFQDTNGDGIGDIPGIIAHLDDLKDLGIGVLWLSPMYPSPNADNGYDISDYRGIHPDFGTMEDMKLLISEAKKRDIRIIMDLVINHTSDEHPWFIESRKPDSPYRDYYIWEKGKNNGNPNNWTSFFGEKAWTYDEQSHEYYLHLFAKKQPDLNYNNPKVIEEVKAIMKYWLDLGIAGFRCDVINIIYKSSLEDGKKRLILTGREHYLSQPGMHKILQELRRDVLSYYDAFLVGETVFVDAKEGEKLCDVSRKELDMIFSFDHMEADQVFVKWFKRKMDFMKFQKVLIKWQKALGWNAIYVENHDQLRAVSRFGNDKDYWDKSAKMIATLQMTLKGTPFIYQGQEIGMTNFDYKLMNQVKDVESININALFKKWHIPSFIRWKMIKASSRDNSRTPMQWTNGYQAGFTTGKPWLEINKNYKDINYQQQIKDDRSIYTYYKKIIGLRNKMPVLMSGEVEPILISKDCFIYKRTLKYTHVLVLINFSKNRVKAEYKGKVLLSNYNRSRYKGILRPYEAIILGL